MRMIKNTKLKAASNDKIGLSMIPSSIDKTVIYNSLYAPRPMAGACHDYLIYVSIDRFKRFNESFDFREEGLGQSCCC